MRTMLVNPFSAAGTGARVRSLNPTTTVIRVSGPKKRKRNPSLPAASPLVVMNPSPRRRGKATKRRRRNPMLPMMANPMRPVRTRRSTRRNPFNVNMLVDAALKGAVTGGGAYLLNKLFISTIGVDQTTKNDSPNGLMMRQGARVLAAALGAYFMPAAWGSAWVGANFYPFAFEMDNWWRTRSSTSGAASSTGAASSKVTTGSESLEAELEAALNGY